VLKEAKKKRGGIIMQNHYIDANDVRRIRPGFGFGRPGFGFGRPGFGFGRPGFGFGRPGFGFGRPGFGLGLGLLGGLATGALLAPALYGGYGYPPYGFY
jgi:hypothetical protein